MSRENEAHGDEDWLAAEAAECARLYEEEHADDYKYTEEWLNENR